MIARACERHVQNAPLLELVLLLVLLELRRLRATASPLFARRIAEPDAAVRGHQELLRLPVAGRHAGYGHRFELEALGLVNCLLYTSEPTRLLSISYAV